MLNKTIALTILLISCALLDISGHQTSLFSYLYFFPCAIYLLVVTIFKLNSFATVVLAIAGSVVYGLVMPLNIGILALAIGIAMGVTHFAQDWFAKLFNTVITRILVFFNVWILLLILTQGNITLGGYLVSLIGNIGVSIGVFILIERLNLNSDNTKFRYR